MSEEVGTPFYCYSTATLERHYRVFAEAFAARPDTLVCYSIKANSNLGVLSTLAKLGAGMDVVSEGELRRALKVGVPGDRIAFSGVGKTPVELQRAVTLGLGSINAESAGELARIDAYAREAGTRARVALRVNHDIDAFSHPHISTGLRVTKFGVPIGRARAVCRAAASLP